MEITHVDLEIRERRETVEETKRYQHFCRGDNERETRISKSRDKGKII